MKALKLIGGFLLALALAFVALTVAVVGLRAYNGHRFPIMVEGEGDTGASISAEPLYGEYLRGYHLTPETRLHRGVVVTYGGSEGSAAESRAQALADAGYEVLALYFFGQEGQAPTLANVPLEQFDEVTEYIQANIADPEPVTVIGASKGAEFALLVAQHGFAVDNVVAFAPAHMSYSGLDFTSGQDLPSFTLRGEPVPYASFRDAEWRTGLTTMWHALTAHPISYRSTYEQAAAKAPEDRRIELSLVDANVLLFAGAKDRMWQSDVAAEALDGPRVERHVFPDAGHVFFPRDQVPADGWELMFGGTVDGNDAAYRESERILQERLAEWHGDS